MLQRVMLVMMLMALTKEGDNTTNGLGIYLHGGGGRGGFGNLNSLKSLKIG
jgi:hypothetical protein